MGSRFHDAYEVIEIELPNALVLTCEHASARIPEPWIWHEEDRWLLDTHWAYDLGAAEVTRELATRLKCPAILSHFTRLLVDPNRGRSQEGLIREIAENRPIRSNQSLTSEEIERRIEALYLPYHQKISETLLFHPQASLLSIHSFTPIYEGYPRTMELAVLFDRHEELAQQFAACLAKDGWKIALNEPYSGKHGLAFSCESHGQQHQRSCLEIEIRQDLLTEPSLHEAVLHSMETAIREVFKISQPSYDENNPCRLSSPPVQTAT